MALTPRGTLSGHANATFAFPVTRHASSQVGDIILVFVGYVARWNSTVSAFEYFRTITAPAGWSNPQRVIRNFVGGSEQGQEMYFFWKRVAAGDSLSYTFN